MAQLGEGRRKGEMSWHWNGPFLAFLQCPPRWVDLTNTFIWSNKKSQPSKKIICISCFKKYLETGCKKKQEETKRKKQDVKINLKKWKEKFCQFYVDTRAKLI